MAITPEQYERDSAAARAAREEAARAAGALAELEKRLAREFDCPTVERAKKLREKLRVRADRAEEEYREAARAYQERWKGKGQ